MSGPFRVGDVVVKVGGPCGTIPKGTVARVSAVSHCLCADAACRCKGILLSGWVSSPEEVGFSSHNFRRVTKADRGFTAEMHALLNKERVS